MAPVQAAVVLVAITATCVAAWYLVRPSDRLRDRLTDRLVYGVPWGTLVVVGIVLSVYLFVQGGLRHWSDPLVLPFRAWSYLYPTGMLTASFAHSSPGHLVGNLIGTLVLAPIVEFAWGHYPPERETQSTSTPSADGPDAPRSGDRPIDDRRQRVQGWLATPWIRAVVLFPAGVVAVGLLSSLFLLGPVVGFSGVVFAFGGFALIHYPVGTLVALWLGSVLRVSYLAIRDPIVQAGISGSPPSPPWWATIAVQGHALGLLVGVVLGLALLQFRDRRANAGRVFLAILVYAVVQDLWAIYWYQGNGQYVLFRAGGLVLVLLLALVVTASAAASDRPLRVPLANRQSLLDGRQLALGWLVLLVAGVVALVAVALARGWPIAPTGVVATLSAVLLSAPAVVALLPRHVAIERPTGRQAAFGALLVATSLVGAPTVYSNLGTVGADPVPGESEVSAGDYRVTYAEDVRYGLIPAVDLPVVRDATNVRTSGVIVVSEERHLWMTAVSEQFLASEGVASFPVGGVGWRETVRAERTGWVVAGNETVYAIDLTVDGERTRAFTSPPARAEPRIANHTVTVAVTGDAFRLHLQRDGEPVGVARIPAVGNATSVGPVTFETATDEDRVVTYATVDGTRVRVAHREQYRDR